MLRPIPQEIVYKGTISDLRISAVDGTAFIDNCAAITAYADNAHRVEIYDSAGKRYVGIAKEAGSGETVGADIYSGWDFTNWNAIYDAFSVDADTFDSNGRDGGVYKISSATQLHALYEVVVALSTTALACQTRQRHAPATTILTGSGTAYHVNIASSYIEMLFNNTSDGITDVTTFTMKQVLTPSTDGIIIVNAKGGSTENFLTKDEGFVHNAASYMVIVKKLRG